MSFALRLQKTPKKEIDQKVREVGELLGLSEYLTRKPAELSGGQRQRVAMGRALTRDSSTFLFDEPLSNLDAKLRTQMRAELATLRQRVQKNMIYVTHDQIEAMTLADRIVVMHAGVIQQQGTPEELFKKPANKFVAGFLGTPPMNFLDSQITQRDNQTYLSGSGFDLLCDAATASRVSQSDDAKVSIGIRPSDFSFDQEANTNESMEIKVVVSEYIGAQSVLIGDCNGQKVMVEMKSDTPMPIGETLRFKVNSADIHIFSESTGLAIT